MATVNARDDETKLMCMKARYTRPLSVLRDVSDCLILTG